MTNSFKDSANYVFTSESVTEGHPDKLCDRISDAILDAIIAQDPYCRVACETAVTTGLVLVMGEITRARYGLCLEPCGVLVSIKEQSKDIDLGVSQSIEHKSGEHAEDEVEKIGA